jgi:hypothetical protein
MDGFFSIIPAWGKQDCKPCAGEACKSGVTRDGKLSFEALGMSRK